MDRFLLPILFMGLTLVISCGDVGDDDGDTNEPPFQTSFKLTDFQKASSCQSCHPDHYDEWKNSMHAYSMKDPVFHSGWEGEKEKRPETGTRFCMQCHSPYAYVSEATVDTTDELMAEGIGCDLCHTMTTMHDVIVAEDNVAASAKYYLNPRSGIKYGQIPDPVETVAHKSEYSPIYEQSQICLPCHDFFIRGLEAEITVTEWSRSAFSAMGIECQTCHLKAYKGFAADPVLFPDLPERTVHRHDMVGVDLDLKKPFSENPQADAVVEMLQSGANLSWAAEPFQHLGPLEIDSITFAIAIENLTGHSFPTGVSFVRELWLEVIVTNESNTFYESGVLESDDADLFEDVEIFQSTLYDAQGNSGAGVTDVVSMTNNSLEAFETRTVNYSIPIGGEFFELPTVKARLLFRPFPPASLRGNHDDLLENLPVVVVDSLEFDF